MVVSYVCYLKEKSVQFRLRYAIYWQVPLSAYKCKSFNNFQKSIHGGHNQEMTCLSIQYFSNTLPQPITAFGFLSFLFFLHKQNGYIIYISYFLLVWQSIVFFLVGNERQCYYSSAWLSNPPRKVTWWNSLLPCGFV